MTLTERVEVAVVGRVRVMWTVWGNKKTQGSSRATPDVMSINALPQSPSPHLINTQWAPLQQEVVSAMIAEVNYGKMAVRPGAIERARVGRGRGYYNTKSPFITAMTTAFPLKHVAYGYNDLCNDLEMYVNCHCSLGVCLCVQVSTNIARISVILLYIRASYMYANLSSYYHQFITETMIYSYRYMFLTTFLLLLVFCAT